jgi:hypothetical protein
VRAIKKLCCRPCRKGMGVQNTDPVLQNLVPGKLRHSEAQSI